jgi:hypothetical protein
MIEPERVVPKPYIPLQDRLKWRRLMRIYVEEARIDLANGNLDGAKIYRQTIESINEWIRDSESE